MNSMLDNAEKLRVKDLIVRFYTYEGIVKAVEKANLNLIKGETLGIVGETGSGKSVTALTIMALTPPPGKVEGGSILFQRATGEVVDILKLNEAVLLKIRGKEISMIFQEPNAALDPLYTVGDQIAEALLTHRRAEMLEAARELEAVESRGLWKILKNIPYFRERFKEKLLKKAAQKEIIELLRLMEIPDPERIINAYPHELSGGMQQRIVIAIALACSPAVLLADEPTTNLDVTVQAQILDLIRRLKERFKTSVIYITHDMGVIAELSDRVAVMYAGNVVEVAPTREIFKNPLHPYTKALLDSIPRPGSPFKSIPGIVPNLVNPPSGCRFHPRCSYVMDRCIEGTPPLIEVSKGHYVACFLHGGA
ncbi:MAG: ABC transporter ATP-binding protein [Candidatus Bathyarchaeia archaeon]